MKKLFILLLTILLVVGAIVLVKKKRNQLANLPTATLPPLVLKLAKPINKEVNQTKTLLATYHALQKAQLATKFAGTIERIFVHEGQNVKKGEALLKIDSSAIKAAIQSQRAKVTATKAALVSTKALLQAHNASLEAAHDAYKRAQKLYQAQAISKEALQKAKAAYLGAKAQKIATQKALMAKEAELQAAIATLKAKEQELAYTTIKAPFDGTVSQIYLKEGSFAPLGKPLLLLLGKEWVFDIPFSSGLAVGMKLKEYPCQIDTILPYSQKSLQVARSFCQAPLPDESSVTVTIVQKRVKGIALPLSALYEQQGKRYLFVYRANKFYPQPVTIQAQDEHFFIPTPTIKDPVATGTHTQLGKLFFTQNVKVVRE